MILYINKKIYLLLVLILSFDMLFAQSEEKAQKNTYYIKIEKNYKYTNHCGDEQDGRPVWKKWSITYTTDLAKQPSIDFSDIITNEDVEVNDNICIPNGLDLKDLVINDATSVSGIGRKGNTTADYCEKHTNLSKGINTRYYSKSRYCSFFHTESYTFTTKITIDDPIFLTLNNPKTDLIIEENEKVNLTVSDFWQNGNVPTLQCRVGADGEWFTIPSCTVEPSVSIVLGYEDIKSAYNSYKKTKGEEVSEKLIYFKVVKKINGIDIYDEVNPIRFFHQGPSFSVELGERSACNGTIKIFVRVDDKDRAFVDKDLTPKYKYRWALVKPDGEWLSDNKSNIGTNIRSVDNFSNFTIFTHGEKQEDGSYLLNVNESGKFSSGDLCILQFQVLNEQDLPYNDLIFQSRWFKIPIPYDMISGSQAKGTEKLITGKSPFLYLDIKDSIEVDAYSHKKNVYCRLPYKIYDVTGGKEEFISDITCPVTSYDDLSIAEQREIRESFETTMKQKYNDLRRNFYKNALAKWYDSQTDKYVLKTTITNGIINNTNEPCSQKYLYNVNNKQATILYDPGYEVQFQFLSEKPLVSDFDVKQGNFKTVLKDLQFKALNYHISGYSNYILAYTNSNVYYVGWRPMTSDYLDITDELLLSNIGDHDAFVFNNGNFVLLRNNHIVAFRFNNYDKGYSTSYETQFVPNSVNSINFLSNGIEYASDNRIITQFNSNYSKEFLYNDVLDEEGEIKSTHTTLIEQSLLDKLKGSWGEYWKEYYDAQWALFLASKYSYKIPADKLFHNKKDIGNGFYEYSGQVRIKERMNCSSEDISYKFIVPKISIYKHVVIYPNVANKEKGKVKLELNEGYFAPYSCNGQSIKVGHAIEVEVENYDEKLVVFIDKNDQPISVDASIPLPCEITSINHQKCSGEGGSIILTPTNGVSIDYLYVKVGTFEICKSLYDSGRYVIKNIPVGYYDLYAVIGNSEVYINSIEILDNSFSISTVSYVPPVEINGKGELCIKADNYESNITWFDNRGIMQPTILSNNQYKFQLSSGNHIITATSNGCSSVLDSGFTGSNGNRNNGIVDVSGIHVCTLVDINKTNETTKLSARMLDRTIDCESCYSSNINTYKYKVSNTTGAVLESVPILGSYSVTLEYNSNKTTTVINDNVSQMPNINCNIIQPLCYGEYGVINIENFNDIKNIELYYSLTGNDNDYHRLSSDKVKLSRDHHEIIWFKYLSKKTIRNGDITTIVNEDIRESKAIGSLTLIDEYDVNIQYSEYVKCHDGNDAVVSLSNERHKPTGAVWYELYRDAKLIMRENDVCDFRGLQSGEYRVLIRSEYCGQLKDYNNIKIENPSKIQVKQDIISMPSCKEIEGALKLTVSGGGGIYLCCYKKCDETKYRKYDNSQDADISYTDIIDFNELTEEDYEYGPFVISGLSSGIYDALVYDDYGCESKIEGIDINKYINPSVSGADTDSVSCYGLSDGVIKGIEVKTNGSLNGNAVSVTEMKYWKVGKEDAAEGEKDAELEKSDEKGWIPYSESIHDLKAGTYKILLKDNNECESGEYSIEVKEPDGIQLAVEPKYKYYGEDGTEKGKIKSYGGDDGEIKVRVDGGNYGYKYVIVEANTTQVPTSTYNSIGNLSAQKYTVIATDNKNCPSNSVDVELVAPLTPLKVEINTTAALCRSRVGSATVAVEGGWSDYKIDLVGEHETRSTVGKTVTYEGLYAGKYELHVTDDMGVTLDTVLVISSPEPISYTYDITPEVCEENTGVIKIEFEDEDPQCKLFFGGQEYDVEEREIRFENLSSNKAGGYVMTIVDKNECESELTFEVPDNKMTVSIEDRYEVNKGVMSAVVDHGAAPYMYKWEYMSGSNEMGTESSFATDKNGIYHLTVTDVNGCTREKTHSLLLEGDRRFIVEEVHRETAFEKKDGLVKLRCEEDEIMVERLYIYIGEEKKELKDVKKDGSSYIIDDLAGGDYSVEGILANGCKVLADFHIKSYEKMDADVVILRHVSRPKYSDGVINVDVTGGIAPYTVRISTEVGDNVGDEMETAGRLQIDNLQAGIYTLSITDSTENVLTLENYEIKEPAPIKVTSTDKRANCYNEKSAEAKIMAEGGWPGYQYADAKDGVYKNSNIFTELPAGRRKFYVIDKYGVVDSIFVRLTEPDELRATVAAIDSVKCKGDSNGSILFEVTGGTPEYKTLMLNNGIAYDMRDQVGWDNLSSGYYTATFTDYNRCETPDTIEFYIPEPDSLEVALMDVVHTTCELDNGKISIRMKGGSLPYKYEWAENGEVYTKNKNIGLTLTQAEGLLQNGLYRVEIRDSHDCYAKTEDVRIAESHNPEIKQDGVQTIDALCKNSSDGTAYVDSADIIVGVPSSPFKLIWSQGQSGVMKVNTLPAGRYEVEIRDDNNCHTTSEFTIEEPDSVSNRLVGLRNALCYGYSDGRIETATIGGVGGYTYLWNTGETTNYLDSIKAGEYTVVVKDAHGCEHVASYEITEPEELKVYLGEDVLICPKGVHVFDGGEYTTYSWRKVATGEEIETGRYMATGEEGDYAIKVTNAIGCIARDTVNLSIGENALIANFLMASDAAVNDTIELIELSNMPIDSLRWVYNTDIFSDVTPYGAGRDRLDILAGETGSYYITMWAYSGGCESFEDKHIDICEALDKDADFEIGYDPIIQSVKATPNPNDGEFNLIVKLREEYDVTVTINSVNTGQQIEKLELKGADKYNHRLNIRDWGSGMYVLSVFVGDERRAVKVVSTR